MTKLMSQKGFIPVFFIVAGIIAISVGIYVAGIVKEAKAERQIAGVGEILENKDNVSNTDNEVSNPSNKEGSKIETASAEDKSSSPSPVIKEEVQGRLEIFYKDNGTLAEFYPKILRIKAGETVRFVNKSKYDMWVISRNFPTYPVYLNFDQDTFSTKGQIYEFTFTESGEYKYFNRMRPFDGGSVIVEK